NGPQHRHRPSLQPQNQAAIHELHRFRAPPAVLGGHPPPTHLSSDPLPRRRRLVPAGQTRTRALPSRRQRLGHPRRLYPQALEPTHANVHDNVQAPAVQTVQPNMPAAIGPARRPHLSALRRRDRRRTGT
ncbi:hypothetical protein COL922a_014357, partial [Colletotrichum nupharicola]